MDELTKRAELIDETIFDLQEVQERILKRHQGDLTFTLRIDSVFKTLINSLNANTGNVSDTKSTFKPKPLKNILGVSVSHSENTKLQLKPIEQNDIEEFRDKVQKAYDTYLERETIDLKDSLRELEIRGVAKLAGIEDYDKVPADEKLINRTKEAIQKKNEVLAKQEAEKNKINSDGKVQEQQKEPVQQNQVQNNQTQTPDKK